MKTAFQDFCCRPLTDSERSLLEGMKVYTSLLHSSIPENSTTRFFIALLRLKETCIEEEDRQEYETEYLINSRELEHLFDLSDVMRKFDAETPRKKLGKDDFETMSQGRDVLGRFLVRQKKTLDHLNEDCKALKAEKDGLVVQFQIAAESKDWETLSWMYFQSKQNSETAAILGQNNPEQVIAFPRNKTNAQFVEELKSKFDGLAKLYIEDLLDELGQPFALTQSGRLYQQQLANANAYKVIVSFVKELHEHLSTTLATQIWASPKTGNTAQFPAKLELVK